MDKKLGFPPNALVTGSFCDQGGEGHFGPPIWELDPHGWRAVTVHRRTLMLDGPTETYTVLFLKFKLIQNLYTTKMYQNMP